MDEITERDRRMARFCEACLLCRQARTRPQGLANLLVRRVEDGLCPYCRAYEKVHGRKAHDPAQDRP